MKRILLTLLINISLYANAQNPYPEVYQSENLSILKISDQVYQHISYLHFDTYGKVSCNGMVVINQGEAIVFDTPTEDKVSLELITWIKNELEGKIVAVVPTHFHKDCLGGLKVFHQQEIPSFAYQLTIKLAKEDQQTLPQHGFDKVKEFEIGGEKVVVAFFGPGHTYDNVVAYFPKEEILFGGCLIKSQGAGKGNLADANVEKWPTSVTKLQSAYPDVKVVIPGHGETGGDELIDYTIQLFTKE